MNLDEARDSKTAALTVTEVAELLGIDVRTVSRGCDDGQIPSLRIGRRLLIPRLPLLTLLGADGPPPGPEPSGRDSPPPADTSPVGAVPPEAPGSNDALVNVHDLRRTG